MIFVIISVLALLLVVLKWALREHKCRTLVILGSGGHTGEMFRMLMNMKYDRIGPFVFVAAQGDTISSQKHSQWMEATGNTANLYLIPRPRQVHQSYISAVFTSAWSALCFAYVLLQLRPKNVFGNGPGLNFIGAAVYRIMSPILPPCHVIYVESWARTTTLSMTGRLMRYFADDFFVQWPEIAQRYNHTGLLQCPVQYTGHFFV